MTYDRRVAAKLPRVTTKNSEREERGSGREYSQWIYIYEIFLCNILSIRNKYIENLKIQLRAFDSPLPFQSCVYDFK